MSGHSNLLAHQRGDTIVEVLLAIAVVSAVLGAAFVSTNNSFNGTRRSQERSEAMKLLQGQLERVKEASKDPATTLFSSAPNPFCMNPANNQPVNATDPVCTQGLYRMSITRNGNSFTALSTWERAGGGGQDRVELTYRVYDEN